MRIATFNILHGRSLHDGQVDVDRFAHAVGSAVTWVLMTVLFYLVFLPAGLFLRRKLAITKGADRRLPTYWIATEERERARSPESYRKQF